MTGQVQNGENESERSKEASIPIRGAGLFISLVFVGLPGPGYVA